MTRALVLAAAAFAAFPALALTSAAKEFIAIARQLEPVHCEKRKLRREIALAEIEGRHARARELRAKFDSLGSDPETARLEARLGDLARRIGDGKGATADPEDLDAISAQQREAYYRCG